MLRKPTIPLLILALLVALVAGCGDDDDGSTTAGDTAAAESGTNGPEGPDGAAGSEGSEGTTVETSSLKKRQFVKRVNAICERGLEQRTEEIEAYFEENSPEGDSAQEDLLVEAFVAIYPSSLEDQLEEIREVGAPQGDKRQIEAILRAFRTYIDAVAALEDIEEKADVDRTVNQLGRLAKRYGIEECAIN